MKYLILLTFTICCLHFGFSQPMPQVGNGHQSKVLSLGMSNNGKYMASLSDKGTIIIWDIYAEKELRRLEKNLGLGWNVDLSDNGNYIVTTKHNQIIVWDNLGHKNNIIFKSNDDLDKSYAGYSAQKVIFINDTTICYTTLKDVVTYDVKNHNELKRHKNCKSDNCFAITFSQSKKTVALYDSKNVLIFDLTNLNILHSIKLNTTLKDVVNLSFHPTLNQIIVSGNNFNPQILNFKGEVLKELVATDIYNIAFCMYLSNEKIVGLSHNNIINWDKNGRSSISKTNAQLSASARLIKDNKIAIANWDFSVGIINFNTNSYTAFDSPFTHCEGLIATNDGFIFKGRDEWIRYFTWGNILHPTIYSNKAYKEFANVQTIGNLQTFDINNSTIYNAYKKQIIAYSSITGLKTNEWTTSVKIIGLTASDSYLYYFGNKGYSGIKTYKLSLQTGEESEIINSDINKIAHVKSKNNIPYIMNNGNYSQPSKIILLDKDDKTSLSIEGDKSAIISAKLYKNGEDLLFSNGGYSPIIKHITIKSNQIINEFKGRIACYNENNSVYAIYSNKIGHLDEALKIYNNKGEQMYTLKGTPSTSIVSHITFSENGKYLIACFWDKSIRIWDWKNNKLLLKIFLSFESKDYHLFTDKSYYYSSKNLANDVYFIDNNDILLFQQYDSQLNRPSEVLKQIKDSDTTLIAFYRRAELKRLSRLGIEEMSPKKLTQTPKGTDCNFNIIADSKLNISFKDLNNIRISLNGVIQNRTKTQGKIIQISLINGENYIEVWREDHNKIKSKSQYFHYKNESKMSSNLYLITLGASKFEQSDFNLKYASKDIKDVLGYFKTNWKQGGVNTLNLIDKDFKNSGLKQISKFLKNTQSNDVVMVYIASHGVFDANYNYFIATHNIDFKNPKENGMSINQLENEIKNCKANKKVVFIDACHSGEIDKNEIEENNTIKLEENISFRSFKSYNLTTNTSALEVSKAIFKDFSSESGITYISSSAGVEYAIEGDQWQNGVFTYAFLNGLKNNKADLNKDGFIELLELENYIFTKVPELTNGKQQPNARVENYLLNFKF